MRAGHRAIGLLIIGEMAAGGCALGKAADPGLTGPSEYGVSLALTASPDLMPRDGRTTSTIAVSAYDGSSTPVRNLGLHLELRLAGGTGGLGSLSQQDVTTGGDGRAVVTYTSPLPAPLGQSDDATVQVVVATVGTNALNSTSATLSIRLTGADQAGGPTASFVLGPRSPKVGDTILFDASASAPSSGSSIVAWAWDFGDGNASPRVPYLMGTGPTMTHEYSKSGPFTVGLTVIDSAGKRATATFALIVAE